MFLSDEGPTLETTRSPTLTPAMAFSMRGDLKLETPAVFCATWMHVTLTERWNDRTCSVVVIWTRRSCQLAEHRRCDTTREGRKHARGEKRLGESSLLLFLDLSRVSSVSRCVLSRTPCSVVSGFSAASCVFTLHRRQQVFRVSNYGALQV